MLSIIKYGEVLYQGNGMNCMSLNTQLLTISIDIFCNEIGYQI